MNVVRGVGKENENHAEGRGREGERESVRERESI